MSTRAVKWAFDQADCPFKHQAVLHHIARDIDATGSARFNLDELAKRIGVSYRTLGRHIKALEELGIICREQHRCPDGSYDRCIVTFIGYAPSDSCGETPANDRRTSVVIPSDSCDKTPANDRRTSVVASRSRGSTESSSNSPSTQSNVVEERAGRGNEAVASRLMKAKGWSLAFDDTIGMLTEWSVNRPKLDLMRVADEVVARSLSSPIKSSPRGYFGNAARDIPDKVRDIRDRLVEDDEVTMRRRLRDQQRWDEERKRFGLLDEEDVEGQAQRV